MNILGKTNKKDFLIVIFYKYICKIYEIFSTIYENKFLIKSNPEKSFHEKGIFSLYEFNNSYLNEFEKVESTSVNNYLSVRIINSDEINRLIYTIFNAKTRDAITRITGFAYSVDFMIFYDRKFIPFNLRNVSTLNQAYSYRWHFDKPNSRNMLKIFLPLNISYSHGPLEVIDIQNSRKLKSIKNIKFQERRSFFTGKKNILYGFNPTPCIHKDGIPMKEKIASQIMFQLNPHKEWAINTKIFSRSPSINNKLGIWTTEPKFPFFAYLFDKRQPFVLEK